MKKIQLIFIFLILLVSFSACDTGSDQTTDATETYIKLVYPEKVVAGQTIFITGNNFNDVTEIVLPDNIVIKDFERTGFNQLSVVAPAGLKSGFVTLRAGGKEYKSPKEIQAVTPSFSVVFPTAVKTGEEVTIKGENLLEIQQVIFPDNVVVDAMHFKRKSDTEIIIVVPAGTIDGSGTLQMITIAGTTLATTSITIEVVEEVVEEVRVHPILPTTKMIYDFNQRTNDWHAVDWDNWGGSYDAEAGKTNGYITLVARPGWWILGCNHPDPDKGWPSVDPSQYVLKVDIKAAAPITITGDYEFFFRIGGEDVPSKLLVVNNQIATPDNDWVTLTIPIDGILSNPTKASGEFGIILNFSDGGTNFSGLSFDNLRFDLM